MGMDIVLSILMLTSMGLIVGAFFLWRRGGQTKQIILMLVLAMVMISNVLIWTLPDSGGKSPAERAAELDRP